MSFDNLIPLQANSPGIFPNQCQVNMTRLKTIVDADHQFNNSPAANDGFHTLIRMIPQAPTGTLAGIGRLYAQLVTAGTVELFYMNDTGLAEQITPPSILSPLRITGTGSVGGFSNILIFPTPAYDYTAIVTLYINNTNSFDSFSVMRSGANTGVSIITPPTSVFAIPFFIGTDLYAQNTNGAPEVLVWSLIINRTT